MFAVLARLAMLVLLILLIVFDSLVFTTLNMSILRDFLIALALRAQQILHCLNVFYFVNAVGESVPRCRPNSPRRTRRRHFHRQKSFRRGHCGLRSTKVFHRHATVVQQPTQLRVVRVLHTAESAAPPAERAAIA